MKTWDDLKFWQSGEWQVMEERLNDWDANRTRYNPERELVFAALDNVPLEDVKVAIIGQDPYPEASLATGVAFSIPEKVKEFPPTLDMIYKEYCDDLHYSYPTTGNLSVWEAQGVLLWNTYPTCFHGKSLSHSYPEWRLLTDEIVRVVADRGGVQVFLGAIAREFANTARSGKGKVLEASHPSPRGVRFGKQPFLGSRIFSRINADLVSLSKSPIDWRLP
jgi:uracil-DNA glycosylase